MLRRVTVATSLLALIACEAPTEQDSTTNVVDPSTTLNQTIWAACKDFHPPDWCAELLDAAVQLTEHNDALCQSYGQAILDADRDDRIRYGHNSYGNSCFVTEPTWGPAYMYCNSGAYDLPNMHELAAHEGCHLNNFSSCNDDYRPYPRPGSAQYEANRCLGV